MKKAIYSASALATVLFLLSGGMAAAQSAPNTAALSFWAAPSVPAGSQHVVLAMFTLDATNAAQNIVARSIPVTVQYSGALSPALTDCFLENTLAPGFTQSGTGITIGTSGTFTFSFTPPVSVLRGTTARYGLVCSVSSAAPIGSSMTFSVNPSAMIVSGADGSTLPVGAANGTSSPIVTGTVMVTAPMASTAGGNVTPRLPNTGAGGDAPTVLLMLALSLLAVSAGAQMLRRTGTKPGA